MVALTATSDDQPIVDALKSDQADVRSESVWFVINQLAASAVVPDAILNAVLPTSDREPGSWEDFGREIVARSQKGLRSTNRSEILTREAPAHLADVTSARMLSVLLPEERDALQGLISEPAPRSAWNSVTTVIPSPAAPGMLDGVLKATKCVETKDQGVAIAGVEYAATGRPSKIGLQPFGLSSNCTEALRTITRMTVAEFDRATSDGAVAMVLPLNREVVACIDRFAQGNERVLTAGTSGVKAPMKVRDVPPVYPHVAQTRHIQGVVLVEAIVSSRGCVEWTRVVRGVPGLDAAALLAVSQWLFTPSELEGQPVAVRITVFVNFTLR